MAALLAGAPNAAALSFSTAGDVPALTGVTLNGQAQTVNTTMSNWGVTATALDVAGWNVTIGGDASAGKSAVFKVYCPGPSACGPDPVGYVSGGFTLPAGSLTLNSTGASFSGAALGRPTHSCTSVCALDVATAVKIASAGTLVAASTRTTTGYSATSLAISLASTLRNPLQTGEVYRVDLTWTLSSGPLA